jgi:hypothetical protein
LLVNVVLVHDLTSIWDLAASVKLQNLLAIEMMSSLSCFPQVLRKGLLAELVCDCSDRPDQGVEKVHIKAWHNLCGACSRVMN